MTRLRLVLGDQLTRDVATLRDYSHGDVVLMAEVAVETTYVKHHKQKIAFVLSAMRHFADELRADGIIVDYVKLDDPGNTGSIEGELQRAVARHSPTRVIATSPGEWRVLSNLNALELGLPPRNPRRRPVFRKRPAFLGVGGGPQIVTHGILLPRDAAGN